MDNSEKDEKRLIVDVKSGQGWKRTLEIEVPKETVDQEFEGPEYKVFLPLVIRPGAGG